MIRLILFLSIKSDPYFEITLQMIFEAGILLKETGEIPFSTRFSSPSGMKEISPFCYCMIISVQTMTYLCFFLWYGCPSSGFLKRFTPCRKSFWWNSEVKRKRGAPWTRGPLVGPFFQKLKFWHQGPGQDEVEPRQLLGSLPYHVWNIDTGIFTISGQSILWQLVPQEATSGWTGTWEVWCSQFNPIRESSSHSRVVVHV